MIGYNVGVRVGALLAACCWTGLQGADTSTVTYPFLGVTHIFRVGSTPDFPRNVKMHIIKIDLTAPSLSFELPPHAGTRDTLKIRTLDYINQVGAQIGMNTSFFNPVTSPSIPGGISADLNTELIGFAASAGNVISPFELPFQNYAIVRDSPGLNIDPNNNASIVTVAPGAVSPPGAGSAAPVTGNYYDSNTMVPLQATANPGYTFQSWTGPVTNASNASTTISMGGARTVTANFVALPTSLSGLITSKSGAANARTWTITLANLGPGAA
jgi:uncharacterized repeat protein (TIGR02543 family)